MGLSSSSAVPSGQREEEAIGAVKAISLVDESRELLDAENDFRRQGATCCQLRLQTFPDAPYIRRTSHSTGSPDRMSAVPSSEPLRLLAKLETRTAAAEITKTAGTTG